MYSAPKLAWNYLRYYLTAMNGKGHGMHSPFVFRLILDVLNNRAGYVAPPEVEQLRQELLRDQTFLEIEDLGAGSRTGAHKRRTVSAVASHAVKPPKYGQLLYRIARHFQPETIVELGTSLGLTAAYFAKAVPGCAVYTIEGSAAVHEVALRNFERLQVREVHPILGSFDEQLPELLRRLPAIDLGFIDGNHRYEPTLRYFLRMLPRCHNDSILVFDDIHWSAEMEQAWKEIQEHPRVRCSVDLFFIGLVFFREEFREPRHFTVRY